MLSLSGVAERDVLSWPAMAGWLLVYSMAADPRLCLGSGVRWGVLARGNAARAPVTQQVWP